MDSFLVIGSVIEKDDIKMVISGYSVEVVENKRQPVYICVPLPMGMINAETIGFVPTNSDFSLIYNGYTTTEHKEQIEAIIKYLTIVSESSDEEIEDFISEVNQIIKEIQ